MSSPTSPSDSGPTSESTQPFGERTPKTRSHFLIDEMKCALDAFVDGAEQSDDITMLCVSIK